MVAHIPSATVTLCALLMLITTSLGICHVSVRYDSQLSKSRVIFSLGVEYVNVLCANASFATPSTKNRPAGTSMVYRPSGYSYSGNSMFITVVSAACSTRERAAVNVLSPVAIVTCAPSASFTSATPATVICNVRKSSMLVNVSL